MAMISPDDAFGLGLIAKDPDANRDLVKSLSNDVQPIGAALVEPSSKMTPEVEQAVDALRKWARGDTDK